jgi:GxxExxY protein
MIHEVHEETRRRDFCDGIGTIPERQKECGMSELLFKEEVYKIVGAAIEVHLSSGFLEPVYQEAMEIELGSLSIPFEAQKVLQIFYKGRQLKREYVADFVCYHQIIVELKALDRLTGKEESQALNYLKATRFRVAILINFGSPGKLEWKRLVF